MARRTLNVSLTPQLEEFISSRVSSGRYLSASEVVRDGLRLLEQRENLREEALDRVRKKIEQGLSSLDRGNQLDAEAFLNDLEQSIDRWHAEATAP